MAPLATILGSPGLRYGLRLAATVVVAVGAYTLLAWIVGRVGRRSFVTGAVLRRTRWPARLVVATIAAFATLPASDLDRGTRAAVAHGLVLLLIAAGAAVVVSLTYVLEDVVARHYVVDVRDNLHARRVRTQVTVVRRVTIVAVVLLAGAGMLLTFSEVRALGASILASAGVVGIVAGVAARSTLGNVVAGVQIAFTEPIRLDDVVVVEGDWGRVEEVTLTYVVVRIWDERRLVLPISYFVEQPFENWTRTTANLLGTVYLYADWRVDVDGVRAELQRVLDRSERWDGATWTLQVTDTSPDTVELRALVSAPDSSTAWDLRCEVREALVAYLRDEQPWALPRQRAEVGALARLDGEERSRSVDARDA